MLKFLLRTFYWDTKSYQTYLATEHVVDLLKELFSRNNKFLQRPNLRGFFTEYPSKFKMQPKWSITYIRNFETRPAYLKGVIVQDGATTTLVISVRPNSVMAILFVVFLIYGLLRISRYLSSYGESSDLFTGFGLLIFAVPLIIVTSRMMSRNLRRSFEIFLEMSQVGYSKNSR